MQEIVEALEEAAKNIDFRKEKKYKIKRRRNQHLSKIFKNSKILILSTKHRIMRWKNPHEDKYTISPDNNFTQNPAISNLL